MSSVTIMTLNKAPVGEPLTLLRLEGNPPLCRRLSALGFRRGAPVRVMQKVAGGGRVVDVAGARIALGKSALVHVVAELEDRRG